MIPVETTGTDIEPARDSFEISRIDFRPHWDGDLVNLFSVVGPLDSECATERLMTECARSIAGWVATHRDRFGSEDRFQIIVGWPKTVRETGYQTIKTGGTFDDLRRIVVGDHPIEMLRGWSSGVFHATNQRPGQHRLSSREFTPQDSDTPRRTGSNEKTERHAASDGCHKPSNFAYFASPTPPAGRR